MTAAPGPGSPSNTTPAGAFTWTNFSATTWPVPAGCLWVLLEAWGAVGAYGGSSSTANGGAPGLGGYCRAHVRVTPGGELLIVPAGAGSGGSGQTFMPTSAQHSGTGGVGGVSLSVFRDALDANTLLMVAGGGGGGGGAGSGSSSPFGNGGNGGPGGVAQNGTSASTAGLSSSDSLAGAGGLASNSSPGAAGGSGGSPSSAFAALAGTGSLGGNGAWSGVDPSGATQPTYGAGGGGGGGGAGYPVGAGGGGGGSAAGTNTTSSGATAVYGEGAGGGGGAGGTSFIIPAAGSVLSPLIVPGCQNGPIAVMITPNPPARPAVTVPANGPVDVAAGFELAASYQSLTGTALGKYALRMRVLGTQPWWWLNVANRSLQTAEGWFATSTPALAVPAGVLPDGVAYEVQVAWMDTNGYAGPYSPSTVVTASKTPTVAIS